MPLHDHPDTETAIRHLKAKGFRLYGTHLGVDAKDYRECDFTGPTAFVLGAEKWGLTDQARDCLLYTSPSPRDRQKSRMPSSA